MNVEKSLHQPGIEPGSVPWQGTILPLDHWCTKVLNLFSSLRQMEAIFILEDGLGIVLLTIVNINKQMMIKEGII